MDPADEAAMLCSSAQKFACEVPGQYVVASDPRRCKSLASVRSEPSPSAIKISRIPAGSIVTVTEIVAADDDMLFGHIAAPLGYVVLENRVRGTHRLVPKEFNDMKQILLSKMLLSACLAGLCNFSFVPAAFFAAKYSRQWLIPGIIGLQVFLGIFLQRRLLTAMEKFALNLGPSYYAAIVTNARRKITLAGCALPCQVWMVAFFFGQVEYLDPTFDAATAGNAAAKLSSSQRDIFEHSWRTLPLQEDSALQQIAEAIADMNLDGVLLLILIVSTTSQLTGCLINIIRLYTGSISEWPLPDNFGRGACHARVRLWGCLGGFAECASLSLAAGMADTFCAEDTKAMAERDILPNAFATTSRHMWKVGAKVMLEAFPSAWFTISFLALIRNFSTHRIEMWGLLTISICTSLFVFILAALGLWANMYSTIPKGLQRCSRDAICFVFGFILKLILLLAMLLAWAALVARFAGVFVCPEIYEGTHQFSILTFNCSSL